ncbi:MAG: hypothetical protein HYY05_04180 [Chloroflexi bacterium]|nr:hypothetical protein [Chloroflexota bacterium]
MVHLPRLHCAVPGPGLAVPLLPLLASATLVGTMVVFFVAPSGPSLLRLDPEPSFGSTEEKVVDAVRRSLLEWRPESDPLVTVAGGLQVKASNYYGVEIEGTRYYYRPLHHVSQDPVTRGAASDYDVVARLNPGTTWEVEIYRLR